MEDQGLGNLSSFIRLTCVAVPARARFIGEAIVSATMSGLAIGLVCGQTGAMATPFGPLVPYLVGTWVGSGLGLMAHWKSSCAYAAMCAEHYPTILAHSLWTSRQIIVPNETVQDGSSMLKWMDRGGLGRYTWCVLAAAGCSSDIEEIERTKRQALMDKINEANDFVE